METAVGLAVVLPELIKTTAVMDLLLAIVSLSVVDAFPLKLSVHEVLVEVG